MPGGKAVFIWLPERGKHWLPFIHYKERGSAGGLFVLEASSAMGAPLYLQHLLPPISAHYPRIMEMKNLYLIYKAVETGTS